jgi:hypothetical protein
MQTKIYVLCGFGLVMTAYAADPFCNNTMKLNLAKSKYTAAPQPPPKEMTGVCTIKGDAYDVVIKGTDAKGEAISVHQMTPIHGGPIKFIEGGPPAASGITVTEKRIDDFTRESVATTKDGKEVGRTRMVMSKDGKTMSITVKGVDPQGKPMDFVEVFEKQ